MACLQGHHGYPYYHVIECQHCLSSTDSATLLIMSKVFTSPYITSLCKAGCNLHENRVPLARRVWATCPPATSSCLQTKVTRPSTLSGTCKTLHSLRILLLLMIIHSDICIAWISSGSAQAAIQISMRCQTWLIAWECSVQTAWECSVQKRALQPRLEPQPVA